MESVYSFTVHGLDPQTEQEYIHRIHISLSTSVTQVIHIALKERFGQSNVDDYCLAETILIPNRPDQEESRINISLKVILRKLYSNTGFR